MSCCANEECRDEYTVLIHCVVQYGTYHCVFRGLCLTTQTIFSVQNGLFAHQQLYTYIHVYIKLNMLRTDLAVVKS